MWGVISLVLSMLSITFILEYYREIGYEKQVIIVYIVMVVLLVLGLIFWIIKQVKGMNKL